MTMFQKGSWYVAKLAKSSTEETRTLEDLFLDGIKSATPNMIPLMAISQTIREKAPTFGLAPFSSPRYGDDIEVDFTVGEEQKSLPVARFLKEYPQFNEWTYDPQERAIFSPDHHIQVDAELLWPEAAELRIENGLYGAWWMSFDYIDAQDTNSKKEQLAYDQGAPFKLLSSDVKKLITDSLTEVNTFTRKHYQVIFDFNRSLVWLNATSPKLIETFLNTLSEWGIRAETPIFHDSEEEFDVYRALNRLFTQSSIQAEVTERLQQIKAHGIDSEAAKHPDAAMQKILENFFALTEVDGYHVGMSAPAGVLIAPLVAVATGVKTDFEAMELLLLNDESTISEACLTVGEYIEKSNRKTGDTIRVFVKRFSIMATPKWGVKDLPGMLIKGFNAENMKHLVKQYVKATDRLPSIAEYWSLWYSQMISGVTIYEMIVRSKQG